MGITNRQLKEKIKRHYNLTEKDFDENYFSAEMLFFEGCITLDEYKNLLSNSYIDVEDTYVSKYNLRLENVYTINHASDNETLFEFSDIIFRMIKRISNSNNVIFNYDQSNDFQNFLSDSFYYLYLGYDFKSEKSKNVYLHELKIWCKEIDKLEDIENKSIPKFTIFDLDEGDVNNYTMTLYTK